MRRGWYWPKGWWCPRHPWPPAWARIPYYPTDPAEELRALQNYKKELEAELAELKKAHRRTPKTNRKEIMKAFLALTRCSNEFICLSLSLR
ncbi:MAG: hypothetical protein QXJ07_03780 [Candidatus Bathyarchaeia archaeon]